MAKISHELRAAKRVRCFGHEKIKSISFGNRVMFFLLYGRQTRLYDFLKFSESLRKCSEIFGNFRKTSEMVQKQLSDVFMTFLKKFSKNLRKSSEIFGKLRKRLKSNLQVFL